MGKISKKNEYIVHSVLLQVLQMYPSDDFMVFEDVRGQMRPVRFTEMNESIGQSRLFVIVPILSLHMGDKQYKL